MNGSAGASPTIDITWFGHSTALVEIAGVRVLTDPVLTASVAHLRRHHAVPEPGVVDVVAISHVHMDHLHPRSLRRVTGAGTQVLVPAGATPFLHRVLAGRVHEVRVGDTVAIDSVGSGPGLAIDAVTAVHSERRGPHTRRTAPALGFVVRAGERRVYFAGDTGPFDAMADLDPVDVALLPIWGWGSTLGEHHLNPTTAAEAAERLRATHVIPIHWGTYSPRRGRSGPPAWLERPLAEFRTALADRGLDERLVALRPGESVTIP